MTKSILCILSATRAKKGIVNIIKRCNQANVSFIYVSISQPASQVTELFHKAKISTKNFLFIDCVCALGGTVPTDEPANVMFLAGPQDVTGLSLAITTACKHIPSKKVVLIDSLSSLLLYNGSAMVGKFIDFVLERMRNLNTDLILLVLEHDKKNTAIQRIESLTTEVIRNGN